MKTHEIVLFPFIAFRDSNGSCVKFKKKKKKKSTCDLEEIQHYESCIWVHLTGSDSIGVYNFEVLSSRPTRLGWPSFFGRVTA